LYSGSGFAFGATTWTVHGGWLAFSQFPQPIQGFILRSKGEIPAWKMSAQLRKELDKFPKEFTSISVSDPRPTVRFLLSLLPTGVSALNLLAASQGVPQAQFDVSLIPNAHEVTRYLFPRITVTTGGGGRRRAEAPWAGTLRLCMPGVGGRR